MRPNPATGKPPVSIRRREPADEREVNPNLLGDFENEDTGIFQAPLHVGDSEVRLCREAASVDMNLHGDGQVVRSAMQGEDAGDLNGGVAAGSEVALIAFGHERDFGKTMQHLANIVLL